MRRGIYKHYKGNFYYVEGVAQHSENEEIYVLYYPINTPDKWWIRPKSMFEEVIVIEGKKVKRFEFIGAKMK